MDLVHDSLHCREELGGSVQLDQVFSLNVVTDTVFMKPIELKLTGPVRMLSLTHTTSDCEEPVLKLDTLDPIVIQVFGLRARCGDNPLLSPAPAF